MVKFLSSSLLLLAAVSSVVFATPVQQDGVKQVIVALEELSGGITHLTSAVFAVGKVFTAPEAFAISKAASEVEGELKHAISEVKGVHSVSHKDGETVLKITSDFTSELKKGLTRLEEKKRVIEERFSAAEVEEALKGLFVGMEELTGGIVEFEPASLKGEAKFFKAELAVAIGKAIKVYS